MVEALMSYARCENIDIRFYYVVDGRKKAI